MALLATITGAVRKDNITIAGQCAGQGEIVVGLFGILQCFQLVETPLGTYIAPIHLIDGLVEDEARRLLAIGQGQLLAHGEEPATHAEACGGGGAVVLHIELMRNLVGLQLSLEIVFNYLEQIEILLRIGCKVGALHQYLPHHLGIG